MKSKVVLLLAAVVLLLPFLTVTWAGASLTSVYRPDYFTVENTLPAYMGENFVISADAGRDAILGKPAIASDGTNFFVVWRDRRDYGTNGYDIYGARVAHNGTVLDPTGIPISTFANYDPSPGNQYVPSVAFDGTNYLVVWTANRDPSSVDYEVYAARVTPDGTVLDPDGLQLTSGANPLRMSSIVFDGTNYFITWRNSGSQIRGARISTDGVNLDGPTSFLIGAGFYPYVAFDGTNYMVIWHGWGDSLDIFGARVTKEGNVLGSFPIYTAEQDQHHASIAFDGTNYLVVWHDRRGGIARFYNDGSVYGTRVSPDGTVLDSPAFRIDKYARGGGIVAFDGTDYLVVWQMDNFEPYFRLTDVYGRRVSKDGVVLDEKGIPIATSHSHHWGPVVGFDTDRYLIAWSESDGVYGRIIQLDNLPQSVYTPPVSPSAPGGWVAEASPASQCLYSIWGFDESNVYAVGRGGAFFYDGSQWILNTQFAQGGQYDVWGISPNHLWTLGWCWAVSYYDGENWSTSAGCYADTYSPGMGVWGTDNTNIMTVGAGGRSTHYDGVNWNEKPTGVSVDLSDIWGTSYDNVYAVGEFGTIIRYDGSEWSQEVNVPTIQRLNGIWGISASDIFAVGDYGTILHYDGTSWSAQESGTTEHLYGVWGSDSSHVYAVGHSGTLLRYNGSEWNTEISGTLQDLFGVGGSGENVWAVGDNGIILRRTEPEITNQPPNQPSNTSPADGATGVSLTPILQSSLFSDHDAGDTHAASHWQIAATSGDYSSPVFDSGVDTVNLTSITIPEGKASFSTTYYWRVRHQDNHGAWSEWSVETSFTTMRLPADVSGDGQVDAADLAAVAAAFNSPAGGPNWNEDADLNQDGIVDIFDLVKVGRNLGGGQEE